MAALIKGLLTGGEPIMGNALRKTEGIETLDVEPLSKMIREELGFTRETKMIQKKIQAAKDPQKYFDDRHKSQVAMSRSIAKFVKDYAEKLREAGFTAEETGVIARHAAKELGDMMRISLEAEYPTEFARKGIEDLLNKKYM